MFYILFGLRGDADVTMPVPTIPAAIRRAEDRFGSLEALVDGDVRLTYEELGERVRVAARVFAARGVRPGDRVAVCAPNTHHWMIAALGALYAGATLVPINTRYTGTECVDLLHRTGARALVVVGRFLGTDRLDAIASAAGEGNGAVIAGLPELGTVLRVPGDEPDESRPDVLEWADIDAHANEATAAEVDARADAVTGDDISDILFTSGTTGRSKGAMSAHGQALSVAESWAYCGKVTLDDRYLVVNPFFHSFGYKAGILVCLLTGATVVPQPVFDASKAMELIQRERVTVLPGAPTIYQTMLDHPERSNWDTSSLRLAVTGAATVPVTLVQRMGTELDVDTVLTAYGLTEAVVVTMCRPGEALDTISRTCGRATAGFEVDTVNSDGVSTAPGDPGEVVVRGPNVMRGYLDDPESTVKAIDGDGWLHTGDIGVLDSEGNLSITDRLKDMYICGGFNVYPAEVEQLLATLPQIRESAVIGVADDRLGEVGKAFVVSGDDTLTEQTILDYCTQHLANYKRPRSVAFVDTLPRNAGGKVLKRSLRE